MESDLLMLDLERHPTCSTLQMTQKEFKENHITNETNSNSKQLKFDTSNQKSKHLVRENFEIYTKPHNCVYKLHTWCYNP